MARSTRLIKRASIRSSCSRLYGPSALGCRLAAADDVASPLAFMARPPGCDGCGVGGRPGCGAGCALERGRVGTRWNRPVRRRDCEGVLGPKRPDRRGLERAAGTCHDATGVARHDSHDSYQKTARLARLVRPPIHRDKESPGGEAGAEGVQIAGNAPANSARAFGPVSPRLIATSPYYGSPPDRLN